MTTENLNEMVLSTPIQVSFWIVGLSLFIAGIFFCINSWKYYSSDDPKVEAFTPGEKINLGMPMSFLIGLGLFIALVHPGQDWFLYISHLFGFVFAGNMIARLIGMLFFFGYTKKHLALLSGEAILSTILITINIIVTT